MANEPDMNPEQGGVDSGEGTPPKHTGSAEATGTNQPDPLVEAPSGDSSSQKAEIVDPQAEDSSKIERVRRDLKFDNKGNFVMTPATAGGPPVSNDPKSENMLNAQIPGRPVGERRAPVPGGVSGGRNPFGGIRGRVAAATIALGTMLGLGGAYVANQTDADTNNNPGGVPTQPVSPEGSPTGVTTTEPTLEPTVTETQIVEKPAPAPSETIANELEEALKIYPEKLSYIGSYDNGRWNLGVSEAFQKRTDGGKVLSKVYPKDGEVEEWVQGMEYGMFRAWQNDVEEIPAHQRDLVISETDTPEQRDAKFGQYMERMKGGEDFIITSKFRKNGETLPIVKNDSALNLRTANFVITYHPDRNYENGDDFAQVYISNNLQTGTRIIEGNEDFLFIELANPPAFGIGERNPQFAIREDYAAVDSILYSMVNINRKVVDDQLSANPVHSWNSSDISQIGEPFADLRRINIPTQTPTHWIGRLAVE